MPGEQRLCIAADPDATVLLVHVDPANAPQGRALTGYVWRLQSVGVQQPLRQAGVQGAGGRILFSVAHPKGSYLWARSCR